MIKITKYCDKTGTLTAEVIPDSKFYVWDGEADITFAPKLPKGLSVGEFIPFSELFKIY